MARFDRNNWHYPSEISKPEIARHQLDAGSYKVRNRKASLSDSEIITILIAFHRVYFTNFKHILRASAHKAPIRK